MKETKNYFLEEIEQNGMVSRKHEKVCTTLNFLISGSAINACISIAAIASLISIPIGITSSVIGLLKSSAKTGKYKSILEKKK